MCVTSRRALPISGSKWAGQRWWSCACHNGRPDHPGEGMGRGVSGGLWRSLDGGNTWQNVTAFSVNLCVSSLRSWAMATCMWLLEVYSRVRADKAEWLCRAGIFMSTDDGVTFSHPLAPTAPWKPEFHLGHVQSHQRRTLRTPKGYGSPRSIRVRVCMMKAPTPSPLRHFRQPALPIRMPPSGCERRWSNRVGLHCEQGILEHGRRTEFRSPR